MRPTGPLRGRALARLLPAVLWICLLLGALPGTATSGEPAGLTLLQADSAGLWLQWVAPPPTFVSGGEGVRIAVAGYPQQEQPGAWPLPYTATLVAVPPGASPRLEVVEREEAAVPLPGHLQRPLQPVGVLRDAAGLPVGGVYTPTTGPVAGPAGPLLLEPAGIVRGIRLARLVFYPARPQGTTVLFTRRLLARLSWDGRVEPSPETLDPLQEIVRRQILNPWDARPAAREASPPLRGGAAVTATALLEIARPGLYRVGYDDMAGLGFAGVDPQRLHLYRGDEEVAYEWEGDDDAHLEPGEAVLFYGEPRFSRWTGVDVYRLVAGNGPGLRMGTQSAAAGGLPAGAAWVDRVMEENLLYTPDCFCGPLPAGRDGDRWTWQVLRRPDLVTATLALDTPGVDATRPGTLTLWLIGYTDVAASPDHRVEVRLDGAALGRVEWNGRQAVTATLPITAGLLSVPNVLTLALPGIPGVAVEGAWLDGLSIRYARSTAARDNSIRFTGETERCAYTVGLSGTAGLRGYDITDPLHLRRLTDLQVGEWVTLGDPPPDAPPGPAEPAGPRGKALAEPPLAAQGLAHHYLVLNAAGIQRPVRVRAPQDPWNVPEGGGPGQADLLIVTHPDLSATLAPLLRLRREQGWDVVAANVLGVYDRWGEGRPDPAAIRALVSEAYASWNPRPLAVLLVGDGSFDPRGYLPTSPPTLLPPYLASVDPWAGEVAADNRYVCVDGDDSLPDLLIGRLPVQTVEEAETAVGKVVTYETNPLRTGWNANVLLVADDPDAGGDFIASSEEHAAAYVTAPFSVTRHYCPGTSSMESDCPPEEAAALHAALLAGWNEGALVVGFSGHASWHQWAIEDLFHLNDLPSLCNTRRLPVVVEMTCFTGAFQRPEPTLDEELVTWPAGGAVASWGATGLGVTVGHDRLSDGFFRAAFVDGVQTVGEATLAGKVALAASGRNLDLLDTFHLLGDPLTRWNRDLEAVPFQIFLPLVTVEAGFP